MWFYEVCDFLILGYSWIFASNPKPKRFDFRIEYNININDWNHLVFWKKLALNQVLRF